MSARAGSFGNGAVQVHHRFDGPVDGPVLVLSNALGVTLEMWDEQVSELSAHFRVLRYDYRGHGDSPVPSGPYSIQDLGNDVLALLDGLELERVAFAGLSLGGMVGMWVAGNAPERIERLALCCTSARFGSREMWLERVAAVRTGGMQAVADQVLARWFTANFRTAKPEAVARIKQMFLSTPPDAYAAFCEALADLDMSEVLARIQAPTLVIAGAEDPASPLEDGRAIERAMSGARLEVLPRAAHLANIEQPHAFTQALLEHLRPPARGPF
jgi:3-oxoadipate enol-lactonase